MTRVLKYVAAAAVVVGLLSAVALLIPAWLRSRHESSVVGAGLPVVDGGSTVVADAGPSVEVLLSPPPPQSQPAITPAVPPRVAITISHPKGIDRRSFLGGLFVGRNGQPLVIQQPACTPPDGQPQPVWIWSSYDQVPVKDVRCDCPGYPTYEEQGGCYVLRWRTVAVE
ncbi:MAG: hypothetical protein ABIL09_05305 [Gemmatimonadota bacterium]